MYICACNGINQKQVKDAVQAGVSRWDQVHAFYGHVPCCGKCKEQIVQSILEIEDRPSDVAKTDGQATSIQNAP